MRRITAVGLSALALCAVIGTSAGTANADATVGQGYGVLADAAGQAAPPPIGKKHHLHFWIKGSDVTGTWYLANHNGKTDRWLKLTVHHTAKDGQQAAVCWTMTGNNGALCAVTTTKYKSKKTTNGWVLSTSSFSAKAALGHVDPTGKIFNPTKSGPWHKIF